MKMKKEKTLRRSKIWIPILMLMLTCSATIIPQIVNAEATNSSWKLVFTSNQSTNSTEQIEKTSFMPGELVSLQVNVTYDGQPRTNLEVSIKVEGPNDASNTIKIYRSVTTNTDGIAKIDFRIPNGTSENPVLGEWMAYCTVATIDYPLTGNLTMNVRWPSLNQEIEMLNETGSPQSTFAAGQTATVKITIDNSENRSFTGNIIANISDSSSQIGQITFENVKILEGSNIFEDNFTITNTALVGEATIESLLYLKIDENKAITMDGAPARVSTKNLMVLVILFSDAYSDMYIAAPKPSGIAINSANPTIKKRPIIKSRIPI